MTNSSEYLNNLKKKMKNEKIGERQIRKVLK